MVNEAQTPKISLHTTEKSCIAVQEKRAMSPLQRKEYVACFNSLTRSTDAAPVNFLSLLLR